MGNNKIKHQIQHKADECDHVVGTIKLRTGRVVFVYESEGFDGILEDKLDFCIACGINFTELIAGRELVGDLFDDSVWDWMEEL